MILGEPVERMGKGVVYFEKRKKEWKNGCLEKKRE